MRMHAQVNILKEIFMKYEECFLRCIFNCLFLDTHASVKCPINLAQLIRPFATQNLRNDSPVFFLVYCIKLEGHKLRKVMETKL